MILVCAFYAIAWLPEKTFILLAALDITMNKVNNFYYVAMFLGFFYICASLAIIAIRYSLNVARCMFK